MLGFVKNLYKLVVATTTDSDREIYVAAPSIAKALRAIKVEGGDDDLDVKNITLVAASDSFYVFEDVKRSTSALGDDIPTSDSNGEQV